MFCSLLCSGFSVFLSSQLTNLSLASSGSQPSVQPPNLALFLPAGNPWPSALPSEIYNKSVWPIPCLMVCVCTWFVGHHNNTDKCTDQSLNMVLQSFPRDFGSYWCGNIVWLYNAHWDPMTLDTIGVKCSNRHKQNCWNSSFGRTLGPWFNLTFQQWKDNFMQTLLLDLINCTEMLLCDWQLDIYLN